MSFTLVSEILKRPIVELGEFDKQYYLSLKDRKEIVVWTDVGSYHTILVNGVKAGIVGFIKPSFNPQIGFVQIVIDSKFRGMGLVKIAEDMLAKKYRMKEFWATIDKKNIASIKAHLKAGYRYFPQERIDAWIKAGKLEPYQTRLYKKYPY